MSEPRYPAVTVVLRLGMPRTAITPAVTGMLRHAGASLDEIAEYARQASRTNPYRAALAWVRVIITGRTS